MHGRTRRDVANSVTQAARPITRGDLALFVRGGGPAVALAAVHFAVAGRLCVLHLSGEATFQLGASCALIFGALGSWFARDAYLIYAGRGEGNAALPMARRCYWRRCGMCLVGCYTWTLFVGPQPFVVHFFWTSFATLHLIVWIASRDAHEGGRRFARIFARRPVRAAAWMAYVLLMLPLACELGLRLYALAVDDPLAVRYVTALLKLPAGGERLGRTVNSQGYWDDEFHAANKVAALRVAAVGDEAVLCGDAHTNFLAHMERLLPGVDVLNFGVAQASPREYAAQFQTAIAPCRPDVVLVFFSVATDVTEAPSLPGPFDWRSLHLVQRSLGLVQGMTAGDQQAQEYRPGREPAHRSHELDRAARQLQVCRAPVPETVQSRWRAVFESLDRCLDCCREEGVEPALVVMPCGFQVDERLCRTLCRRAGYRRADQIDIDLPQRRLAAFAKDRRITMLDLMPHMRASKSPTYARDLEQFNDQGNAMTATILSDWLQTQYGSTLLAKGS